MKEETLNGLKLKIWRSDTDNNIRFLVCGIVFVGLLLAICVSVDYADSDVTVSNLNESAKVNLTETSVVNGTHYVVMDKDQGIAKIQNDGKVIISKAKYPIVSMWARPSVRCSLPYKWYYRSFVDYCPHCKRYNVLYDAHKPQAKFEHEWTCKRCGADYDAVVGKEKYSWSHYYLRRV